MVKLFGVDIADEIHKATKGQLHSGTISREVAGTRTPGSLTAGTQPTTSTFTFEGTLEYGQRRLSGLTAVDGTWILMITNSISPATEPILDDEVTIRGKTFKIIAIKERDPAEATYLCKVDG